MASFNHTISTIDRITTYTTTGATGRITAVDLDITYSEIVARVTAVDLDVTYSEITARITAVDLDLTYSEITARITAVDLDVTYDPIIARITAVDLDVTYSLKAARITAVDLDTTYSEITARITAVDLDLTYSEITARITEVDLDLTYSEIVARVTAVDLETTYSLKTGRITAVDLEVTYTIEAPTARITAVDLDVTYSEIVARITAVDLELTYSEITARVTAVDLDITYNEIAARITAVDLDVIYSEKLGRITAVDLDLTYNEILARITAVDLETTYTPTGALGRITAIDLDIEYTFTGDQLVVELPLSYRLGITYGDGLTWYLWALPTTPTGLPRADLPKLPEASTAPEMLGTTAGAVPAPILPSATGLAGLFEFYVGDVYWRIWCVPEFLRPQNPELNVDIPFILWQAYTESNTLNSIGGTGQDGLTLDLVAPRVFFPVEELEVNLQITPAAPNQISATYLFNFDEGQGVFLFETVVSDWIKVIPEIPVKETWQWLTDITIGNDSTEQRTAVRRQPRRFIEYGILIEDDIERQREYDRIYNRLANSLVVPFYQYFTRLTQNSLITESRIYFDPARTDFRANELAVIYRPTTEESFLIQIGDLQTDGADTATPLTVDLYTGDLIAPAFNGRLANRTSIDMTTVAGALKFNFAIEDFRSTFNRVGTYPIGSQAVINTYDGYNILDRCPMANQAVSEAFDIDPLIIDSESGVHDQRTSWLHAFIGGARKWNIKRLKDPDELDWWRDFITEAWGMREPFLMPSYRQDLFLASTPNGGDPTIEITSTNYATQYFPHDTYTRFRFTNPDGDQIYRKATDAQDLPGGTTELTLDTAVPNLPEWSNGFEIEYLNKVRFASDTFTLTHYATYTILSGAIRTVDE